MKRYICMYIMNACRTSSKKIAGMLSFALLIGSVFACSKQRLIKHFNSTAAAPESKPDEIMRVLDIRPGMAIADIGSGGGYFTFRFARATGKEGIVYAVDVEKEYLDYIRAEQKRRRTKNIVTILSDGKDPGLPRQCCDIIFLRNVYHHLPEQTTYFKVVKNYLKPTGKLVIIEYSRKMGRIRYLLMSRHSTDPSKIKKDLKKAGYVLSAEYDFLPRQSFLVFQAGR